MAYDFPVVVVHWLDAVDRGDGDHKPRHRPELQVCVGWLLRYDDDGISLAFEYTAGSAEWRNETFIPTGMIKSVEELHIKD